MDDNTIKYEFEFKIKVYLSLIFFEDYLIL